MSAAGHINALSLRLVSYSAHPTELFSGRLEINISMKQLVGVESGLNFDDSVIVFDFVLINYTE